ncbi:MAG: hypothetical protein M1549_00370 [Candidatus Dependentiae bacterium]|nr:hypothetical protein [Candidatus Dependentiae bacterium]
MQSTQAIVRQKSAIVHRFSARQEAGVDHADKIELTHAGTAPGMDGARGMVQKEEFNRTAGIATGQNSTAAARFKN